MYIGLNEDQQALRRELRSYYADLLTPEIREELHREAGCGPVHRPDRQVCKTRRHDRRF